MENKIQVNDQELMIKEYEGQRVVTMWDISRLHGTDVRNIRMNFRNNIKHLIEGEDYFLIDKENDFAVNLIYNKEVSRKSVNAAKDIPVFTEAGYLLMTKPMTDEISWKVQRQLVNCYFKVKDKFNSGIDESEKLNAEAPKYILEDINKTLEILTAMYKDVGATTKDTIEMTRSLLRTAGIELPEVKRLKTDTKNFIELGEVARRVGVYAGKGEPNKQAVLIVLSKLNLDYSNIHIVTTINNDTNEEYVSVLYSPDVVDKVGNYLSSNNYPELLEQISVSGCVVRCKVNYKFYLGGKYERVD